MAGRWQDLWPPRDVRKRQEAHDRRAQVWRMRQAGFTLEAIARMIGVTRERVRQMEARFLRTRQRRTPVEEWLDGWRDEISRAFGHRPYAAPVVLDAAEILRRARDVVQRAAAAEKNRLYWEKQRQIIEAAWAVKAAAALVERRAMMEHETKWRLEEILQGTVRDNLFSKYTTPELMQLLQLIDKLGEK